MLGWLLCWLVGWLVSQSVDWLVNRLVSLSVGWLVGWLVGKGVYIFIFRIVNSDLLFNNFLSGSSNISNISLLSSKISVDLVASFLSSNTPLIAWYRVCTKVG